MKNGKHVYGAYGHYGQPRDDRYTKAGMLLFGNEAPELISEAYKEIRTNILYLPITRDCKRIAITSANAREGKTITSINIALSLAQLNNRVLLIDADMRAATIARYLKMNEKAGLSEYLAGIDEIPWIVGYPQDEPEIDVLLTGKIPPNPSELLLSLQMEQLMKDLEQDYDYIIVDTPPVNVVTDATTMIDFIDSYLLVVRNDHSNIDDVKQAVDKMEKLNANIGGIILNDINVYASRYGGSGYNKYYNKYYSGYYGHYGSYYPKR